MASLVEHRKISEGHSEGADNTTLNMCSAPPFLLNASTTGQSMPANEDGPSINKSLSSKNDKKRKKKSKKKAIERAMRSSAPLRYLVASKFETADDWLAELLDRCTKESCLTGEKDRHEARADMVSLFTAYPRQASNIQHFFNLMQMTTHWGNAVLLYAIQAGNIEAASELLTQKLAEVDKLDKFKQAPLHYAAVSGSQEMARVLLNHGADIHAADDRQRNALWYACKHVQIPIIELFVVEHDAVLDDSSDDEVDIQLRTCAQEKEMEDLENFQRYLSPTTALDSLCTPLSDIELSSGTGLGLQPQSENNVLATEESVSSEHHDESMASNSSKTNDTTPADSFLPEVSDVSDESTTESTSSSSDSCDSYGSLESSLQPPLDKSIDQPGNITSIREKSWKNYIKETVMTEVRTWLTNLAGETSCSQSSGKRKATDNPSASGSSGSTSRRDSDESNKKSRPSTRPNRKNNPDEDDDDDDDDGDDERNYRPPSIDPTSSGPVLTQLQRQFICPYFAKFPKVHEACGKNSRSKGWGKTHRLKAHLYNRHKLKPYCSKCYAEFASPEDLSQHFRYDECIRIDRVRDLSKGFGSDQEAQLRKKSRVYRQTEEDKWRIIYQILFPGEEAFEGSPYVEDGQITIVIDDVLQLVESNLQQFFSKTLPGIDETIKPGLRLVVQKCRATIYERYQNLPDQVGSAAAEDQSTVGQGVDLSPVLRISDTTRHENLAPSSELPVPGEGIIYESNYTIPPANVSGAWPNFADQVSQQFGSVYEPLDELGGLGMEPLDFEKSSPEPHEFFGAWEDNDVKQ